MELSELWNRIKNFIAATPTNGYDRIYIFLLVYNSCKHPAWLFVTITIKHVLAV